MSLIVEVPLDNNQARLLSLEFPHQLNQIIDPSTYQSIVNVINQSISQSTYSFLFKILNRACFISIFIPVVLHFYDDNIRWEWCFLPIAPLFMSLNTGFAWHIYTRRKAIQAALVIGNNQLIGHQPPISVRLYHQPSEYDCENVGIVIPPVDPVSPPSCLVGVHQHQFAGRKLFIEVGPNSSLKPSNDSTAIEPELFAVDVPLDLTGLASMFGSDYCTIYPAPLSHVMSRDEYAGMIGYINDAMHRVKARRFVLLGALVMVVVGLILTFLMRGNAAGTIGLIMLFIGVIVPVYEMIHHMRAISRVALAARERVNTGLMPRSPLMRLVPLMTPNVHRTLMIEQASKAGPLILVIGYQGSIDHPMLVDETRADQFGDLMAGIIGLD